MKSGTATFKDAGALESMRGERFVKAEKTVKVSDLNNAPAGLAKLMQGLEKALGDLNTTRRELNTALTKATSGDDKAVTTARRILAAAQSVYAYRMRYSSLYMATVRGVANALNLTGRAASAKAVGGKVKAAAGRAIGRKPAAAPTKGMAGVAARFRRRSAA